MNPAAINNDPNGGENVLKSIANNVTNENKIPSDSILPSYQVLKKGYFDGDSFDNI